MGERTHTPGPWGWFGNGRTNTIYLATVHGGRRYVMDFTRWGMRGAQPRFQRERGGMINAQDLLQFEVGDRSVVGIKEAKQNESIYRLDVRGIDCPDARLIAAAPDMYDALRSAQKWLAEQTSAPDDLQDAIDAALSKASPHV